MQYIKTIALLIIGILGLLFSPLLHAQTTSDALNLFQRDSSMARRSILDNPTGGAVLLLEAATIQQLIQHHSTNVLKMLQRCSKTGPRLLHN